MTKVKQGGQLGLGKLQDRLLEKFVIKVVTWQNKLSCFLQRKAGRLSLKQQRCGFFLFCIAAFPLSIYLIITGFGVQGMYQEYRQNIQSPVIIHRNDTKQPGKSTLSYSTGMKGDAFSDAYIDSLIKMRVGQLIHDSLKMDTSAKKNKN